MRELEEKPELYIATAVKMLDAEGMTKASNVLRSATVAVEETGFDNWNGGTRIWTVFVQIDPSEYALLGVSREVIEEQIQNRLKPLVEQLSDDWFGVTITPKVEIEKGWRKQSKEISTSVRRNIIDGLILDEVNWSGRLDDVEFLERLFDLEALPSTDSRFKTAAADIWQHRINNYDWPNDWVYSDNRLNIFGGTTDNFLRFLCELVHPVVRPDRNEALKLVPNLITS